MTILSDKQIFERLGDTVVIEPFNPANVNTSSYDVTLGEWYFIERKPALWRRILGRPEIYNMWDFDAVRRHWGEPIQATHWVSRPNMKWFRGFGLRDKIILLPPKRTILAHTNEFIGGRAAPPRSGINWYDEPEPPVTTMMKARSSYGRNGIEVCKCAGYGDVGYFNRWTMEITNNLRFTIPLIVGRRIAQIVFMETGYLRGGDYGETGKYQPLVETVTSLKARWNPYMMYPRLDLDRGNPNTCPHGVGYDDCPYCRH